MRERLPEDRRNAYAGNPYSLRMALLSRIALLTAMLLLPAWPLWAKPAGDPDDLLPDAPQPQNTSPANKPQTDPCQVKTADAAKGPQTSSAGSTTTGVAPPARAANPQPNPEQVPCPPSSPPIKNLPLVKKLPIINWYARFLDGPQVKPMTPKEKAWLAVRNVGDPFNGITILGSSAIAVGANSHSPYGPGMTGFGRYVGVSYTQDMTGEFFGTFLIPSIAHQDPHYHRMPTASMKKRVAHAMYQVVWTQGDNGQGMLNYANLVGFAIDDEIGNLYIPGRQTDLPASAARYGTSLATAPIDNFVTEFLPDVARKIHIRVVLIQQIINQVANKDGVSGQP